MKRFKEITNTKNFGLERDRKLNCIKSMLEKDFKYHNVKANVEFIEIKPDIFNVIIQYQSLNHHMFSITCPLIYKSVERILNGDLAPYYEIAAFIYGTILKMEVKIYE